MNDELKNLISAKADKTELTILSNLKSNKVDTELALRWINVMHKQIKQTVVLITEMIKFEL